MPDSDPVAKPTPQPLRALISSGLFLLGTFCTWGPFYLCTTYNLLGFRGSPRQSNPFAHQNVKVADLIVLGIITAVVAVLTMYRAEKKLAPAFVFGMWLGLTISLGMILWR